MADGLIATLMPRDDREALYGDLAQDHVRIAHERGRHAADRWYLSQAAIAVWHAAVDQVRAGLGQAVTIRWHGRDLRDAVRSLRRSPGFTVLAVSSLAVGIGATTATFGLVYSVLMQPLALPDADRLVTFDQVRPDDHDSGFSFAQYRMLKTAGGPIVVSAVRSIDNVSIRFGETVAYLTTDFVDGDYFQTLGLKARLGRLVDDVDERSAARVLVVSEVVAQRYFRDDSRAIGAIVDIRGVPFTIVGIAPREFRGLDYPGSFAVAAPSSSAPAAGFLDYEHDADNWFDVVGRLHTGVDARAAAAQLDPVFQQCCGSSRPSRLALRDASHGIGGKDDMRDELRRLLIALLAAVVLVLVIACVNVANLQIVRGAWRAREFALRMSLGASRSRLVGQLLTESLLLAVVGAAGGLAFAAVGRAELSRYLPRNYDVMSEILRFHVDSTVLLCTIAAATTSLLVAGVLPALLATRVEVTTVLRTGARSVRGDGTSVIERVGVIAQISLALLLVTLATLLSTTLWRLSSVDSGLQPDRVSLAGIETRGTSLENGGIVPVHSAILDRVRAQPGVSHAAMATFVPFYGGRNSARQLELLGAVASAPLPSVMLDAVTPDFFASAGIPLVGGRDFRPDDAAGAEPVIVVSESLARALGDRESIIGRSIRISGSPTVIATVIGIARDAKLNDLRSPPPLLFYAPVLQTGHWPFLELVVRTTSVTTDAGRQLEAAVNAAAPGVRVRLLSTLSAEIGAAMTRERFAAVVSVIFACFAVGLSTMGLYGLMSQYVARRRVELGVRSALGARGIDLVKLVARRSSFVVIAGVAAGLPAAMLASRLVASNLFGVTPWEPRVFAAAAAVIVATSATALAVPARRAARADPLTAIRSE